MTVTSNRQDGEADSAATTEATTEPIVAKDAGRPRDPAWWQWALIVTLFPLGLTAPFGTTILGVLATNDIPPFAGPADRNAAGAGGQPAVPAVVAAEKSDTK